MHERRLYLRVDAPLMQQPQSPNRQLPRAAAHGDGLVRLRVGRVQGDFDHHGIQCGNAVGQLWRHQNAVREDAHGKALAPCVLGDLEEVLAHERLAA